MTGPMRCWPAAGSAALLHFRLDHVDVQLVVDVRVVFGLAEAQAGNVDVLRA